MIRFRTLAVSASLFATLAIRLPSASAKDPTPKPGTPAPNDIIQEWSTTNGDRVDGIERIWGHGARDMATRTIRWTIPFRDAWHFYAKRCGFQRSFDEAHYVMAGHDGDANYLVVDRVDREAGKRRFTFFIYNAVDYSLSVLLYPEEDGKKARAEVTVTVRSSPAATQLKARPAKDLGSGDPANLRPKEIRRIWDSLTEVVLKPNEGNSGPAGPTLSFGEFETLYSNAFDLYMTDRQVEIARDLGIRAWTVDFEGGPFNCWFEYEEQGQKTMSSGSADDQVLLLCDVEKGRLLFWFLAGVSEKGRSDRSRRIMKQLKQDVRGNRRLVPDGIMHGSGLQVVDGPSIDLGHWRASSPALWSDWNGVSFKRSSKPGTQTIDGEVTLLAIEATEEDVQSGSRPRKLTVTLKAKPQTP